MKRTSVVGLAILLGFFAVAPSALAAPGDWQRVLDLPSGSIYAATFASDDVTLAAGGGGIFRSADRGATWEVTLVSTRFMVGIDAAPDGVHGWTVGMLGEVLYTADGGRTWTKQDSGSGLNFNHVEVIDADSAILGASGEGISDVIIEPQPHSIRRTDDGGVTWREVPLEGFTVQSIDFFDGQHGWIAGDRCEPRPEGSFGCESRTKALFRTQDGGATWERVGDGASYRELAFTSEDDGWAVRSVCVDRFHSDCPSSIAVTGDGGETSEDVRTAPVAYAYRGLETFGDGTVLVYESYCPDQVAPNCINHLIESADRGATWTEARRFEAGFGPSTLAVAPAGHVMMFTYREDPEYSPDRRDWRPAAFPLTLGSGAFDFIDARTGWFAASKLLRTTDAGATFEPVSELTPVSLDFVSATHGWASTFDYDPDTGTNSVTLQRTTDGGLTWQTQYSRDFGNYLYLRAVDEQNAWAFSLYDRLLLHTRDGGASWYEQVIPVDADGNSPSIVFVDEHVAWMTQPACDPGFTNCTIRTWITTDGGDTWRATATAGESRGCPAAIEAVDSRRAWITTSVCSETTLPYILRTVDAGMSWQRIDLGTRGGVTATKFFNPFIGRMVREECSGPPAPCRQTLARTNDGGTTWMSDATGIVDTYGGRAQFVSPERAWLLNTIVPGLTDATRQEFYRFVGGRDTLPPVFPPDAGSGPPTPSSAFAAIVLLLVIGVVIGTAGVAMR